MKNYIVFFETGFCGEDDVQAWLGDPSDSDALWEAAIDHARQYDHSNEYEEGEDYCEDEDLADRIGYTLKEYDPEEHDMFRCGCGSFQEDFDNG
jgi:hypothetical protein